MGDFDCHRKTSKVLIQNQFGAGKLAKRWDKSGMILEHLGFNKYRVKVDGSGRITDRNRQFLMKFTLVTLTLPGPTPNSAFNPTPQPINPSRSQVASRAAWLSQVECSKAIIDFSNLNKVFFKHSLLQDF